MTARPGAAALAVLVTILACDKPVDTSWHDESASGYRWRSVAVTRGGRDEGGFTRMAPATTGIAFQNQVSDSVLLGNRILGQGAGVAIGDVDGDGLADVFLAKTEGCNALYRNLGEWRFEDVSASAGVGACDRFSTGAALADVDGDNDLDLVLLATKGPNAIFVNDGKGRFTERRDLGLDPTGKGGTTIALADVDGDGRLDMYVANYRSYNVDDSIPPQQRAFNQMVRQVGPNQFEIVPQFRNEYRIVMRPDMGGLRMSARGAPDDFYRNAGGSFQRVALTGGAFKDAKGKAITEENESFTLAATFADLNGDGAPDLYVGNDFEDTDELWYNDGHGNFTLADWTAIRQTSNSTMGVDVGDVNNDGRADLFEVDMLANDQRLKTQIPTHTSLPKRAGDVETQLQQQRNALFVNRGDGTYAELSMLAGVGASGWSWGTMFMDVDLDGWQDLLIANGHLWDIMDADVQEGLQNRLSDLDWRRLRWQFPPLKLKNVAFRNRGNLSFEDASDRWAFGTEEDISHALAAGDLDGDGDLDVVVNRLNAPALVLRNDAARPRVAVRLIGDAPNTRAVGARIRLEGGATPLQSREVRAGGIYMSHSDYLASFAMGASDSATLAVEWRDGRRSTLTVHPNRLYEVRQRTAVAVAASAPIAPRPTLFQDASAQLGGHTHIDPAYDDWERQFLLPNSLSQLGPGVAWFDFDRDGDDDLAIGTGAGGRLAYFRNDNGKLVPQRTGPTSALDVAGLAGFATNDGTTKTARLVAGVSSWEAARGTTPVSVVSVKGGARSAFPATADSLAGAFASASGPIAIADYDGDGDLDLFVGGRAIPGAYPREASSRLFRNDNGVFDQDDAQPVLRDIGLVSGATFADIDGDGDADLVLAREWGSIALLLNDKGTFKMAPASWGLPRWTGRWNGVAVGDLDADGRLDIVATNWGRNTMTPTDTARPLVVAHGPFGSGGEEEILLARADAKSRTLMPLNSYARARVVMQDLPNRVSTFAAYANATLDQVLGGAANRVHRDTIRTFDHMVFLNRGTRFDAVPLPVEAQEAPAFGVVVADFDGDAKEDVFIAQNFSATAVGLPRYDGGRALVLAGDGRGGFTTLDASLSGIAIYGDQRGAAASDFDGDGRTDLAVGQNAGPTKVYRNATGTPGLRVRLEGPASNPDGVGAIVRLVFGQSLGPARVVSAGSGYWSQSSAVQVLGIGQGAQPSEVLVRWPDGKETRANVLPGAREVVVKR